MGLFPQFPYSNLHELNLDWIIEQIRQVTGEGVVLSVNGLSGVVTLYTENNITLPDCHFDTEWSVARLIDEKVAGLKFTGEKFFYITKNHDAEEFTVQEVYTSGNQPPYPVTSVNGHDGAVVLAGDNLPYVIDGSYTIEDIVEAIQGSIGAVIRGKKCDQAVTAGQYVFLIMSNITGRTDGLYKAVNDVPANTDFATGDLFPATIGLGGKLGEAEDDIDDLDTRLTSVETDTATLKDDLPIVAESVAFIINGSTCPQAVTAGQYVILIHSTVSGRADGFYKAINNVSANTAWTSADLQAVSGGLGAEVDALNSKVNTIHVLTNAPTVEQLQNAKAVICNVSATSGHTTCVTLMQSGTVNVFYCYTFDGATVHTALGTLVWNKTMGTITLEAPADKQGNYPISGITNYCLLF